jgi:hypothetical protein
MTENGKTRQGKMARTQGRKARHQGKMAKDGKARTQRTQGKDAAAGRRTAGRSKVAQYSHTVFERV